MVLKIQFLCWVETEFSTKKLNGCRCKIFSPDSKHSFWDLEKIISFHSYINVHEMIFLLTQHNIIIIEIYISHFTMTICLYYAWFKHLLISLEFSIIYVASKPNSDW